MSANAFKAVTWNVLYSTKPRELKPILRDVLDGGVSILLLQEFIEPDVRALFRDHLDLYVVGPQYAVAWTDRWTATRKRPAHLATAGWERKGHVVPGLDGAMVRLQDGRNGPELDALSYHLPSGVQTKGAPLDRLRVTRQAVGTMRTLKRESIETGADACLFGGDDNVDERLNFGPWKFMEETATGLKLTQAPEPTHAGGRKLDDFRTYGLTMGHGWTQRGGGDHRLHGRVCRWK